ncbi:MAG: hypothetical protein H6767_00675 [Candidatus Peribacteria bacterium]|nr:MAG: hypothetical protein H6767_00675 [Candidatus Peribacteria bacterium]
MGVYFGKKDIDTLTEEEITILLALIHEPSVKSLKEKSFQNYMQKIKTKLGFQFEPQITKLAKKENIDQFPFVTNRWCPSIKEQGGQCILQASIDAGLQQFAKDILSTTLL